MNINASLKRIRQITYWVLLSFAIYLIPKSYYQWKTTEEKLDQISKGANIEGFDTEKRIKVTEGRVEQWLQAAQDSNTPKTFCPPASDRKFWDKLDKPMKQSPKDMLIIGKPSPLAVLNEGAKQECFYNTGEWIPEIEKALREILSEPWSTQKTRSGKDFVDLAASTTAREISHALAMLGDKLSPGLVLETKKEIRKRIIDPYRKELGRAQISVGYFGSAPCPWLGGYRETNWIAVCVANIIYCSMVVDDIKEQASLIAKSKEPIEDYLKTFEADGSIAAGIRYWDYGFRHLLLIAELLDYKTNGNINLFDNPKLAKMVTYPFHTFIGKNKNQDLEFYPLFADNKNPYQTTDWLWDIINRRFEIPQDHVLVENRALYPEDSVGAAMDMLVYKSTQKNQSPKIKTEIKLDSSHYYPNNGVLTSRFNKGNEVVTIAGGNNGTEHNHNDIGSYTFFSKDTKNYWLPMFGDMGDVKYTDENFTAQGRYKVPLLSSFGHPVPVVNNQLQFASAKARSQVIKHSITNEKDSVKYDLLSAYNVPNLTELTREAIIHKTKDDGLEIIDSFTATFPINFESPIITATQPEQGIYDSKSNTITFEVKSGGQMFLATVYNADLIDAEIENIEAIDFAYKNKTTIRSTPYKIGLKLKEPALKGEITYKLSKLNTSNQPIESKAIPPRMED